MQSRTSVERQRGAAAVEFGIVLVFLLLILAGIVEFGRAFWYYDALSKATRDGARLLSLADKATFTSFIAEAQNRVVTNANSANLNPALTAGEVTVTCLDATFNGMACGNGAATPANIRVAISGYTINIGGLVPFLSPTGGAATTYTGVPLAPHTTMPYMK